jgi:hypothetical protein
MQNAKRIRQLREDGQSTRWGEPSVERLAKKSG